jgi:imidazolonepropionase-like amidohydrolase
VVRSGGLKSLEIMRDAGLPMAFGSDLLGGLRKYHCMEFELLAKVLTQPKSSARPRWWERSCAR